MTNFEDIKLKRITYSSDGNELEGLIITPDDNGPHPLVIFIHGHNSVGAWENLYTGYLLQKAGFAVFIPSMLGYGFGPKSKPDFCGPKTVKGILDGMTEVKKLNFINKDKIGVWGISRGAIVASLIATKNPELVKVVVLQSGAYDIKKDYEWNKKPEGIKENMLAETDGTDTAWTERSSLHLANSIESPVLILHGEDDTTIDVDQARMLDKALKDLNKEHQTVIIPNAGHFITPQTRRNNTLPFLEKYLK